MGEMFWDRHAAQIGQREILRTFSKYQAIFVLGK